MEDKEPQVDYAGQFGDRQREVNNRLNMYVYPSCISLLFFFFFFVCPVFFRIGS